MKKIIIFLFLTFYFSSFSQSKKLFFALETDNAVEKKFIKENKISSLTILYQGEFVSQDTLNEKLLVKSINSKFPDKNSKEYAVLDWEGKQYDALFKDDENASNIALNMFVKAVKIAKKERPNMKWSFYGIPDREFWAPGYLWEQKNLKLSELFKNLDFIAPSVYLFYTQDEIKSYLTENYITRNVGLAIKIGKKYNKEVYPFIWHRFHPSNQNYGMALIPTDFFSAYIKNIYTTKIEGNSINGIIWWHAESYFSKNMKDQPRLQKEYKGAKDYESYNYNNFKKYLKLIKPYFK